MSIDLDFLTRTYFYFDEAVPYQLNHNHTILIKPVPLLFSEIFLSSCDILNIDKNTSSNPEIIQMSYLQFLCCVMLNNETKEGVNNKQKVFNILNICTGLNTPSIHWNEHNKPVIYDEETTSEISSKQFDEIKTIILHQNIIHFDDNYINPELKQAMADVDALKNSHLQIPNLERKMAIITAHSGLSKKEQQQMTYRSHCLLFEEVCGEVEFTTTRPALMFGGNSQQIEHWIYKKNKDKFEGYIKNVDSYTSSMGGTKSIRQSNNTTLSNNYTEQFNSFHK